MSPVFLCPVSIARGDEIRKLYARSSSEGGEGSGHEDMDEDVCMPSELRLYVAGLGLSKDDSDAALTACTEVESSSPTSWGESDTSKSLSPVSFTSNESLCSVESFQKAPSFSSLLP